MRQLSKAKCGAYHRDISEDFRALAGAARRHNLFDWWSDLNTIAAQLANNESERWGYSLNNVIFSLPPSAVLWPREPAAASCRLTLDVTGVLETDRVTNGVVSKITGWQANLAFEAVDEANGRWYQFWHFDRHPGGNVPPEIHPLYHANFGGGKMEECRVNNGGIFKGMIEMAAPRLHLAPMDAVLFVDFVISNFDGGKWTTACGDPGYVDLVARAQDRVWRSYFRTLADFFTAPKIQRATHQARELWPNLAVSA